MEPRTESPRLLGESDAMQRLGEEIRLLAAVDATVLIEGEPGTGKTLVARAIHAASRRRDGPFVSSLDVWPSDRQSARRGATPAAGTFGRAGADSVDLFGAARGGTLLLEQIAGMPPRLQAMLLRVLESPARADVGGHAPRPIDVRVLATTYHPLEREVAAGRFRQDLFYRLRIARIVLPPLRQRSRDIPVLALEFLRNAAAAHGKDVETISTEAMDRLIAYRWPGNVRELQATIEAAMIRATGETLRLADLLPYVAHEEGTSASGPPSLPERERLHDALRRAGGNRSAAARLLGIGRATLYRQLARLDSLEDRERER